MQSARATLTACLARSSHDAAATAPGLGDAADPPSRLCCVVAATRLTVASAPQMAPAQAGGASRAAAALPMQTCTATELAAAVCLDADTDAALDPLSIVTYADAPPRCCQLLGSRMASGLPPALAVSCTSTATVQGRSTAPPAGGAGEAAGTLAPAATLTMWLHIAATRRLGGMWLHRCPQARELATG